MHTVTRVIIAFLGLVVFNVFVAALNGPWYAQPIGVLRWVTVTLGERAAAWLGHRLAVFFSEIGALIMTLLKRLTPALEQTFFDLFGISFSWFFMFKAFVTAWDNVSALYARVSFLFTPEAIGFASAIGAMGLVYYALVFKLPEAMKEPEKDAEQVPVAKQKRRAQD